MAFQTNLIQLMHEGLMKKGLRSLLLQVPVFSAFKIKGYLQ